MKVFIPYDKLSKRARKAVDSEKRGTWYGINPATRTEKNPKAYDRRKAKAQTERQKNEE